VLKNLVAKIPAGVGLAWLTCFAGCSNMIPQGPSDAEIAQQTQQLRSNFKRCMGGHDDRTLIDNVKVSGKSINGNDATILIQITYHWPGDWPGSNMMLSWIAPPCTLLNAKENGAVEMKMVYKKYDTGWHFEGYTQ